MDGKSVKVNGSGSVDGIAVWNANARTGKLLLGRNRTRVDNKQVLGAMTLQLKGAAGSDMHLRAKRLADSGAKPSNGFESPVESDLPIKNAEVFNPTAGIRHRRCIFDRVHRSRQPARHPASEPTNDDDRNHPKHHHDR